MASFTVNFKGVINRLERIFEPTGMRQAFEQAIREKAVAKIIMQAIAYNFDQEGPGWKPLQASTIRNGVSKAKKKKLSKYSDAQILQLEAMARGKGEPGNKRILYRSGLLKRSVTNIADGNNVHRVEGTKIVWGTKLGYAAIHNKGGTIRHPGSKNAFGIPGFTTKPHNINIPKREFLKLSALYQTELYEKVGDIVKKIMKQRIREIRG